MRQFMLAKICFTICVISIITGAVIALMMIWREDSDDLWKPLLTALVIFLTSGGVLAVDRTMKRAD